MAKTNVGLAAFAVQVHESGAKYYWGGYGQVIESKEQAIAMSKSEYYQSRPELAKKVAALPAGTQVFDCRGIIDGYNMQKDGAEKIGYVPALDRNANSAYAAATVKGAIATLPKNVPGVILHKDGHDGVAIGDDTAVDIYSTGVASRRRAVTAGGWTHWYQDPDIVYLDDPTSPYTLTRLLKEGCTGEDVREWQRTIGVTADGVFGVKTRAGTIAWQKDHGLTADGIVGKNTATAAGWIWQSVEASSRIMVGKVNAELQHVRTGPGMEFPSIATEARGKEISFNFQASSAEGRVWYRDTAQSPSGQDRWMSSLYIQRISGVKPDELPLV